MTAFKSLWQPIFARKYSGATAHKSARARVSLGQKEESQRSTTPKMTVWRRTLLDGTRVLVAKVSRAGGGVLPIRITRVSGAPPSEAAEIIIALSIESGLIKLPHVAGLLEEPIIEDALLYPLGAQRAQAILERDQLLDLITPGGYFTYRDYSGLEFFDSESLPAAAARVRIGVLGNATWQTAAKDFRLYELTGKLHYAMQIKTRGLKFPEDGLYMDSFTGWIINKRFCSMLGRFIIPCRESVNDSYILYTVALGTYYLIHFNGGVIRARRLGMSTKYNLTLGEVQEQLLRATEEEGLDPMDIEYRKRYQRYEGYILACLDFFGSWENVGTYSSVVGSSFAYGWKPTWDGSKVSIATNVAGGQDSVDDSIALPHHAYLYTVTITGGGFTEDGEEIPIDASVTEIRDKVWTPRMEPPIPRVQGDIIWQPDQISLGKSNYWFPHTIQSRYLSLIIVADVPIYCFYNHRNQLVLCNYSYDEDPLTEDLSVADWYSTWETWHGPVRWDAGWSGVTYKEILAGAKGRFYLEEISDNSEVEMYADPALLGAEGIDVADVGVTTGNGRRIIENIQTTSHWDCDTNCQSVLTNPCNLHLNPDAPRTSAPFFDPDGCGDATGHFNNALLTYSYGHFQRSWADSGNIATDCWPTIVIPNGNAESIYLLEAVEEHGPQSLFTTWKEAVAMFSGPGAEYHHWFYSPNAYDWWGCTTGFASGCTGGGGSDPADNSPLDDYEVKRVFVDKYGVREFDTMTESGWFPESSGGLFVIPVNAPYYIGMFFGVSGVEGPKFYQQHPGGDDFGDFNSNVNIEWDDTHMQMFAGWA